MIILPSDPDCSDLLMKTVCYQNVIMTGNSSLNGRKCSRKRIFNDFIQAYSINFCSLYIYKMDLFMLLLIIMKLKTPIESPAVGISVTVPTNCQLGDVVRTKHLPGLICHVAVGPGR